MAITALATANTQIGPAQFADLTTPLEIPFRVDTDSDLRPSRSGRTITVASGAGHAGGSRIRSTASEQVTVDAQSAGQRWDAICIRIDWSTSTASLVAIKGSASSVTVNRTSAPNEAQINRIPGVMYDALIATVRVALTGVTVMNDMRLWGGRGGPYRIPDASIDSLTLLDAPVGTWVATDKATQTRRLDDDGTWRGVGTVSNPWHTWTPTLRYYGANPPNGTSGGTVAGLGSNGSMSARYRVVDGMLDGYVYISPGPTGATLGRGQITIDLPLACASWQEDTWSMGHLYTRGYGGDGNYDWPMQCLVKKGWTRGGLWTNPIANDVRLEPYRAQSGVGNGGAGSGTPFIKGGFPVGDITMHMSYPVGS